MTRQAIEIIELPKGWGIKFPFALKDKFKAEFPTAKWQADLKQWQVGVRSKKKLDQFKALIEESGIIEIIAEKEEVDSETLLTDEKVKIISASLSLEKTKLKITDESISSLQKSKILLSERKATLDALAAEFALKDAEKRQTKIDVKESLAKIISLKSIQSDQNIMNNNFFGQNNRKTSKTEFEDAQSRMIDERDKLRLAGLESVGLNQLCYANRNRPDRDHSRFITEELILTLIAYPESEEE